MFLLFAFAFIVTMQTCTSTANKIKQTQTNKSNYENKRDRILCRGTCWERYCRGSNRESGFEKGAHLIRIARDDQKHLGDQNKNKRDNKRCQPSWAAPRSIWCRSDWFGFWFGQKRNSGQLAHMARLGIFIYFYQYTSQCRPLWCNLENVTPTIEFIYIYCI